MTEKFSWSFLIRSYKIYHDTLVFQDLGKIFQVLQEVSRSCMSYQGAPSFSSLGKHSYPKSQSQFATACIGLISPPSLVEI